MGLEGLKGALGLYGFSSRAFKFMYTQEHLVKDPKHKNPNHTVREVNKLIWFKVLLLALDAFLTRNTKASTNRKPHNLQFLKY